MSITVRCPGCARTITLAEGDSREQVRCPACGFTFERPAAPPDAITAEPPPRANRANRAIRAGGPERRAAIVTCEHCGEPLRAAAKRDDESVRCPVCGNLTTGRSRQITAKAPAVRAASTGIVAASSGPRRTEDEDTEEYRFAKTPRRCPRCDREFEDEAVLCLGCGYNAQTGEQAVREYTEIDRTWDGGLSTWRRLALFAVGQAMGTAMVVGAILGDFTVTAILVWLAGTALLAYTLGTFSRLEVKRSHSGHVKVTKTWRFCFVPLRPSRINLRTYEGVATGMAHGADMWDWMVLATLLGYGMVPGLIWWYWTFHRDTYYVGLTRDHGMLALDLYRGWDESVMRDIAHIVRDVGGYPAR